MNVSCNKSNKSDGLIYGRTYKVVAISINLQAGVVMYNIVDDLGRLAFYESDQFNILDGSVDTDWIVRSVSKDYHEVLPYVLSYPGFYEDFHNSEPQALKMFAARYPDLAAQLY